MAKAKTEVPVWAYDVIRRPIVTEKSTTLSQFNQVTFEVSVDSTKPQIKDAIEVLYGVGVVNVNTIKNKGKAKRFKGIVGKRKDTKKAIITVKEGDTIDVMAGA